MTYFDKFKEVPYTFKNGKKVKFTNMTTYSDVFDQVVDATSVYSFFSVTDGERPDIVSERLYGTSDYYWTFFMLNPDLREKGWPQSVENLNKLMNEQLPGECLVFLPQDGVDVGDNTDYLQHAMIDAFPVGSNIFGQISGASGVVYARNVDLGQLFVRKTNDIPFLRNESVVDVFEGAPDSQLIARIVHNPAYLAVHHFEDGDGDNVDVDYALDFRGRGNEGETNIIGGVVGDLVTPDPYALTAPYNTVTWKEWYQNQNQDLSNIKIVKPGLIGEFVKLRANSLDR